MDLIKKYIEEVSTRYSVAFSASITVLPFVIAFVMTLYFAHGNMQVVGYVLTQVGIVNIWMLGLTVAMTAAVAIIIMRSILVLILEVKTLDALHLTGIFVVNTLAVVILPIAIYLGLFLGAVIAVVMIMRKRKTGKIPVQLEKLTSRNVNIAIAVFILYTAITSYPNTLTTVMTLDRGKEIKTKILVEKGDYYVVYKEDDKKLEEINKKSVKARYVCSKKTSFISKSVYDLVDQKRFVVKEC